MMFGRIIGINQPSLSERHFSSKQTGSDWNLLIDYVSIFIQIRFGNIVYASRKVQSNPVIPRHSASWNDWIPRCRATNNTLVTGTRSSEKITKLHCCLESHKRYHKYMNICIVLTSYFWCYILNSDGDPAAALCSFERLPTLCYLLCCVFLRRVRWTVMSWWFHTRLPASKWKPSGALNSFVCSAFAALHYTSLQTAVLIFPLHSLSVPPPPPARLQRGSSADRAFSWQFVCVIKPASAARQLAATTAAANALFDSD